LEFVDALVDAVAVAAPDLAAVGGDVATASAFAGSWVERCHQGAEPAEGQRIHRLVGSPRMPLVSGTLRPATSQDLDLVCRWSDGFALETGGFVAGHDAVRDRVRRREVWLWDDGGPVAMAAAKAPVASVSRVGPVYTPPESRGRGFAGAAVATLSAQLLSSVATTCILYTQLSNPTSNSVYRRIGYEPVIEVLRYRFIPRQPGEPRPRAGELRS
jgi:GNAT superfamily N-acetyltransferase